MKLRAKNFLLNTLHTIIILLIIFLSFSSMVFLSLNIAYRSTYVYGKSMQPTLNSTVTSQSEKGDMVLISRYKEASVGDIVIATPSWTDRTVIKRLVGKPGDTIQIKQTDVYELYCNDTLLYTKRINVYTTNYYTKYQNVLASKGTDHITLGENEYFIMGDNWGDSSDSITNDLKTITSSQLHGKVDFVVAKDKSKFFSLFGYVIKGMLKLD